MNWYLSKVIFQIICGDGDHTPQFDEQLRLIEASDENEAYVKAREIGMMEQEVFTNTRQQPVQWKFINIAELYKLNGFTDGAELYSRIHEADDADDYIDTTHRKAAHILAGKKHQLLQLQ